MKKRFSKKNLLWGIFFIAMAILLILNALGFTLGLPKDLPAWKIIISVALILVAIDQLSKKKFHLIYFPLIFIVMIFEGEFANLLKIEGGDIASWWVFILIAMLLSIGTGLLTKSAVFTFTVKIKDGEEQVYTGREAREKYREIKNSTSTLYLDCGEPINKKIDIDIGKADVFFTNSDLYDGNGVIDVECNLATVVFHIPDSWIIDCEIENSLASVAMTAPITAVENAKHIKITGENNLGKIRFIRD